MTVARPTRTSRCCTRRSGRATRRAGCSPRSARCSVSCSPSTRCCLTAPERRATIADLRVDGTRRGAIAQMVVFQALCLGLAASAVGLLAGYALAVGLLHQSTGYLSQAFTLGSIHGTYCAPLLIALACGLLATCLGACTRCWTCARGRALDAAYARQTPSPATTRPDTRKWLSRSPRRPARVDERAVALVPSAALAACVLLALATMLAVPMALAGVLRARRHARRALSAA